MNIKQAPLYGVIVLILIAAGVLGYLAMGEQGETQLSVPSEDGTYHMVLEENGYNPKQLVIPKGSTVVFSTTRGRFHWPASNLHPNHEIYSEFDPKEPVPPEEAWSFTFDRAGSWNLHDHLRSYYRARIEVIE